MLSTSKCILLEKRVYYWNNNLLYTFEGKLKLKYKIGLSVKVGTDYVDYGYPLTNLARCTAAANPAVWLLFWSVAIEE